jgi:uncharacterized protein (DUF1800 family)
VSGISQYSGPFGKKELVHLLKRTMFGAKPTDIAYFEGKALNQVVELLLDPEDPHPEPPIKEYNTNNATVPDDHILQGTTWVDDITADGTINSRRRNSYRKWFTGVLINQDRSILEKMTMFWINHFGTEATVVGQGNFLYYHNKLIRTHALGNFKTMVDLVTKDCLMLRYLNGYLNRRQAPDENYARELQELFTVGKNLGESGYNEDDVVAAARVLTGWRINNATHQSYFQLSWHDTADKQFSSFYNNAIIYGNATQDAGQIELDALLNMIFAQDEVARHIVRKLYRWFVYYEITPEIEDNVISPLADTFRNNNYDIKPMLRQLFMSEHFFDPVISIGAVIKSPVDFLIAALREWEVGFPDTSDWQRNYTFFNTIHGQLVLGGQPLHDPGSVAGYAPYYQAPQYHGMWLNASTYPLRKLLTDRMLANGYSSSGFRIIFDVVSYTEKISDADDPNKLIDNILTRFYCIDLLPETKQQIKTEILLSGQSEDFYWTNAWQNYLNDPANTSNLNIVKLRLTLLYQRIMNLEEYQLS